MTSPFRVKVRREQLLRISPRAWPDAGDSGASCQGVSWEESWAILGAHWRGSYGATACHLRTEAGLADRGRSPVLRPPGGVSPHARRAIHRSHALGPGLA